MGVLDKNAVDSKCTSRNAAALEKVMRRWTGLFWIVFMLILSCAGEGENVSTSCESDGDVEDGWYEFAVSMEQAQGLEIEKEPAVVRIQAVEEKTMNEPLYKRFISFDNLYQIAIRQLPHQLALPAVLQHMEWAAHFINNLNAMRLHALHFSAVLASYKHKIHRHGHQKFLAGSKLREPMIGSRESNEPWAAKQQATQKCRQLVETSVQRPLRKHKPLAA